MVYLGYMFVSIYFLSLFVLLYKKNKRVMFDYPTARRRYGITVIVPAYNEEETVEDTVEAVLAVDYPGLKEVIVVDDGSRDGTLKIIRRLARKYNKVRAFTKKNEQVGWFIHVIHGKGDVGIANCLR